LAEDEKKPGAVGEKELEKPGAPSVATREEENDCDRENHRYHIAALLIGGLIFIISIPVCYKNYENAGDLAAIFSGWITSVVGFYFLQQNTEKAQQQTTIAAKDAAEARKAVAGAAKTSVNLVGVNKFTEFELKKRAENVEFKWKKRAENYRDLYEKSQIVIKKLMDMQGGED